MTTSTVAGHRHQQRRLIAKTAGVTAVLTFLATQAAGWLFQRIADDVAAAATPAIEVQSAGPRAEPWNVVVPQAPGNLKGARVRAEAITRWALNQGGAPSETVKVELTIWGNRDYPVLLEAVRASAVDCQPAPGWTKIEATVGGAVPERLVTINLDSGHYDGVPEKDPSSDTIFRFPLQVSRASLEYFSVRVNTATADCSYKLEVVFRDDGRQKTVTIDDGGSAFRVTSPRAATARMEWHSTEDGFWSPTPV